MFPYTRLRDHKDHVYEDGEVPLLKAAAIYGANGAGKSNLIRAMQFVRDYIKLTPGDDAQIATTPYLLSASSEKEPSSFEFEFRVNGAYYAYGLVVLANEIQEEWLFRLLPKTEGQELIFERKGQDLTFAADYRNEMADRKLLDLYTQKYMSPVMPLLRLLSGDAEHPDIQAAHFWLTEKLRIVFPQRNLKEEIYGNPKINLLIAEINDVLGKLDTGVECMVYRYHSFNTYFGLSRESEEGRLVQRLEAGGPFEAANVAGRLIDVRKDEQGELQIRRLVAVHEGEDGLLRDFDLEKESDGTQRIMALLPFLLSIVDTDATVVVDEMGRSLHPVLFKSLLHFFMRTPTKGQLIFTTHEEHLLDLDVLRKDEIWFLDKSKSKGTFAYPLSDFQVRADLDIQKGYLNGRFSGIPYVRQLDRKNPAHVTS